MNTNEQREAFVSIEDAIKISKILCTANEERIPMILNVFDKAGVFINGLEELEDWKSFKDMAYIVDIEEFVADLFKVGEVFEDENGDEFRVEFKPDKFAAICKELNIKPSIAKRALYKKGYLKAVMDGQKLSYTVPVWRDGKTERRIVIDRKVYPKAVAPE